MDLRHTVIINIQYLHLLFDFATYHHPVLCSSFSFIDIYRLNYLKSAVDARLFYGRIIERWKYFFNHMATHTRYIYSSEAMKKKTLDTHFKWYDTIQ